MLYSIADTVTPVRAARQVRNLFKMRNTINESRTDLRRSKNASVTTHTSTSEIRQNALKCHKIP